MEHNFRTLIFGLLFTYFSLTFAEFEVVGSGIVPLRSNDVGMVFYVTVRNTCPQSYKVTINMVKCLENIMGEDPDCKTVNVVGGNMGELQTKETRNLSYIYPNLYPYNRFGECQLAVWYGDVNNKPKEIRVTVPFDTRLNRTKVPHILKDYVEKKEVKKCASMDEDPMDHCMPVNCPVKYSGQRNFFNRQLKKCQVVPACIADPLKELPDVTYSPTSNTCQGAEITDEDIKFLTGSGGKCNVQMKSHPMPHLKSMRCHHGHLDAESGFCVCDDGWTSSPIDPDQFNPSTMLYHMCTIEVRSWSSIYDKQFQTRYVIVAIFAVSITLLIVCCAFCVLEVWQYLLARSGPSEEGLYDCDGYKMFNNEYHSSRASSRADKSLRYGVNQLCYCGDEFFVSDSSYDSKALTVCTKYGRNTDESARSKDGKGPNVHYSSEIEDSNGRKSGFGSDGVRPNNVDTTPGTSRYGSSSVDESRGKSNVKSSASTYPNQLVRRSKLNKPFPASPKTVLRLEEDVKSTPLSQEKTGIGKSQAKDKNSARDSLFTVNSSSHFPANFIPPKQGATIRFRIDQQEVEISPGGTERKVTNK